MYSDRAEYMFHDCFYTNLSMHHSELRTLPDDVQKSTYLVPTIPDKADHSIDFTEVLPA